MITLLTVLLNFKTPQLKPYVGVVAYSDSYKKAILVDLTRLHECRDRLVWVHGNSTNYRLATIPNFDNVRV